MSHSPRGLPPLPRKLARVTDDLAYIPPGYGCRVIRDGEMAERASDGEMLEVLMVFEPPLRGHRYIVSADVGDGLGQDRSSVDVIRVGTIERIEEQVAHYISDQISPSALAFVIDAVGRYYCDDDGIEAMAAIETNNHGLSTQDTLQLHLGYSHFYLWEYLDSADPAARFTKRIGWFTTTRTRPMLIEQLHTALTNWDPVTALPDLRVNSPWTLNELPDFQTEGALWEAEAARGAHDDCVLSLAIGHYVAWRQAGGETEPLSDRRRRRHHIEARRVQLAGEQAQRSDFRNMAYTEEEAGAAPRGDARLDQTAAEEELMYDPRGRAPVYDDEFSSW